MNTLLDGSPAVDVVVTQLQIPSTRQKKNALADVCVRITTALGSIDIADIRVIQNRGSGIKWVAMPNYQDSNGHFHPTVTLNDILRATVPELILREYERLAAANPPANSSGEAVRS